MGIFFHDEHRNNTREDNSDKYPREEDGCYKGDREGDDGVVERRENPRDISDEKERERTSCPEEMIEHEISGFSEFFPKFNFLVFGKFRDDILDIGTSPWPSAKLFVLRSNCFPHIRFLDDIHFAHGRHIDNTEYSVECKITPPVLESILDDTREWPIIGFFEAVETHTIDGEVPIKFRILGLGELPERRPHSDESCKKCPFVPIIGIHRGKLIDGIVWKFRCQKRMRDNEEEIFLDLGVTIYRRHKCGFFVKFPFFGKFFDRIGDIWSLYLSFSLYIDRMRNTENLDSFSRKILKYFFRDTDGVFPSFFRSEEYGDIFFIGVVIANNSIDVVLDYIIWLIVEGNNDDMFQIFCFILDNIGFQEILFISFEEGNVRGEDIVVRFKYLHRPIGDIECDEKYPELVVDLEEGNGYEKYRHQKDNGEFREESWREEEFF